MRRVITVALLLAGCGRPVETAPRAPTITVKPPPPRESPYETHMSAGRAAESLKDWAGAIEAFTRAELAASAPERSSATEALDRVLSMRDWALAKATLAVGDWERAASIAIKAARAKEAPPELLAFAAAVGYEAGLRQRKREYDVLVADAREETDTYEALKLWTKANEYAETAEEAIEALSNIMALQERLEVEDRIAIYEERLEWGDRDLTERDFRGAWEWFEAAARIFNGPEVAHGFDRIRAAAPDFAYAKDLARAREHRAKREWAKARAAYERALASKPGDPDATRELDEIRYKK